MSVGDKGKDAEVLNKTNEIDLDPIFLFHNHPKQRVSQTLEAEYYGEFDIEKHGDTSQYS